MIAAAFVLSVDSAALRIQPADLPGLLWSTEAGACAGDGLPARQCRGVREARSHTLAARTFVVTAGPEALERGADGFAVRGCLRCDGDPVVVTRGGVTFEGGRVVGPVLGRGTGTPPASAHVDLYFRLGSVERWTQEGHAGVAVQAIGWRVYDACRGDLLAASPTTPDAAADQVSPAACAAPEPAPLRAEAPVLDQPTSADVKTAMGAVLPDVERCFDRYGVPGSADVWIEVDGDGEITYTETRGSFHDTPTGACVATAVRKAHFPRFQRAPMRLHYPFLLR